MVRKGLLALTVGLGIIAGFTGTAQAQPTTRLEIGVVEALDYENDEIIFSTAGGDWTFYYKWNGNGYGIEDWMIGDIAALELDEMGTDIIFDDQIIRATYRGWIDEYGCILH